MDYNSKTDMRRLANKSPRNVACDSTEVNTEEMWKWVEGWGEAAYCIRRLSHIWKISEQRGQIRSVVQWRKDGMDFHLEIDRTSFSTLTWNKRIKNLLEIKSKKKKKGNQISLRRVTFLTLTYIYMGIWLKMQSIRKQPSILHFQQLPR